MCEIRSDKIASLSNSLDCSKITLLDYWFGVLLLWVIREKYANIIFCENKYSKLCCYIQILRCLMKETLFD